MICFHLFSPLFLQKAARTRNKRVRAVFPFPPVSADSEYHEGKGEFCRISPHCVIFYFNAVQSPENLRIVRRLRSFFTLRLSCVSVLQSGVICTAVREKRTVFAPPCGTGRQTHGRPDRAESIPGQSFIWINALKRNRRNRFLYCRFRRFPVRAACKDALRGCVHLSLPRSNAAYFVKVFVFGVAGKRRCI